MELKILLPDDSAKQGIINLKQFIDKAGIEGLQATEIERVPHKEGQMGAGDILNSVKTLIEAATVPLIELVKCLQKYVDNYRTVITIPTKRGDISLKHGRSMSSDQLKKLVVEIMESDDQ